MNIKNFIAIVLVLVFVVSVASITLFILTGVMEKDVGLDLLKNVTASTSGFVGIIVGHYFSSTSGDGNGQKAEGIAPEVPPGLRPSEWCKSPGSRRCLS